MTTISCTIWSSLLLLLCFIDCSYKLRGLASAENPQVVRNLEPAYSELPVRPATVAVIYTGDLRSWVNSVDSNIEILFNHIANNCTVHVYMMPKIARQANNPTTVVDLGKGLEKIRPYLRYFMPQEADFEWDDVVKPPDGCTPPLLPGKPEEGWIFSFYQQFISIYRVYQEVVRQEMVNGWRYEWYIRSRMDIRWTQVPLFNLTTASTDKIHVLDYNPSPSVSDHFAVVHSNIADLYMTVADKMFQGDWCHPVSDFDPYCHVKNDPNVPPECLLARWLVDHKIQWEGHTFSFAIDHAHI